MRRSELAGEEVGAEDYAQDNCQGDLDGGETGGQGGVHLSGNHKVGTPEDAGARNQWKDSADEEDGAGALEAMRGGQGQERHQGGGEECPARRAQTQISGEHQVGKPSGHTNDSALEIEFARNAEKHCK